MTLRRGRPASSRERTTVRFGRLWRTATAVVVAATMTVAMAACANDKDDEGFGGGGKDKAAKEVTLGFIAWDENIAVTELWKQLLEAKGYKVDTKQLEAAPLFSGVASGSLDVFMDAWLPGTHADYWKQYGDKVNDIGVWYEPADLGLAVPSYVKVDSLAELKDHADEFDGKITGIEASAGMMGILKDEVVPQYGLDGKLKVTQSSTPAMLASLDKAYKAKKPIVVTMWRPHWAFSKYDIKYLDDPKKAWGDPDKIHTITSKQFSKNNAEAEGWMKNFKLTPDQLQDLENKIQEEGVKNKDVAVKAWIEDNKELTDSWLTAK